jgi:hypothetical protein
MKNYISRIAIGLLLATVIFLTYVDVRQAQVVEAQRHLLVNMYRFIQAGCPFSQLQ